MNKPTLPKPLTSLIEIAAFLLLVCSIFGLFSHLAHNWGLWFELLSHFKLQYALSAFILAPMFIWLKRFKIATVMVLLCLVNSGYVLPWYTQKPPISNTQSTPLKLLLTNVNAANQNHQLLLDLITQQQPDIIVALEVTTKWTDGLTALKQDYPYTLAKSRQDNFGIAIYSKMALDNPQLIHLGKAQLPSIVAKFNYYNQPITLVATHPLPPIGSKYLALRDDQLQAVAEHMAQIQGSKILIGDLNITMWSDAFQQLLSTSQLKNTRQGFGVIPTWPSQFPLSIAAIPIDHCLVSSDLNVGSVDAGSNIGSDHLPLIVTIDRR